jgi:hypothetical protein
MAKGSSSRKRKDKFTEAMEALEGVGVPKQEFGQLNKDGTDNIDLEKLEELKEKLGAEAWRKVRFVALNAPFKRRSPIPSA